MTYYEMYKFAAQASNEVLFWFAIMLAVEKVKTAVVAMMTTKVDTT